MLVLLEELDEDDDELEDEVAEVGADTVGAKMLRNVKVLERLFSGGLVGGTAEEVADVDVAGFDAWGVPPVDTGAWVPWFEDPNRKK